MRILRLCAPLLSSLLSLSILPALQAQSVPTFNVQTHPSRTKGIFGAKADLNNDGVPDLIFCCDQRGKVWYQLSDGNGAFLAPVTLGTIYSFALSIATGDFNNDGRTDVAVPDPNPFGGLTIHYNQGGGIFTIKGYFGGWNQWGSWSLILTTTATWTLRLRQTNREYPWFSWRSATERATLHRPPLWTAPTLQPSTP
jgi:hypothetical protein